MLDRKTRFLKRVRSAMIAEHGGIALRVGSYDPFACPVAVCSDKAIAWQPDPWDGLNHPRLLGDPVT